VESNVHGSLFSNQYHPDFSRIRLKMFAQGDRDTNLILDLTTIDHELSRDSQTGKVKLSISYRGYFEQSLNMPENDALSDSTVSQARTERRREIAEKLSSSKCEPDIAQSLLIAEEQQLILEAEINRGQFINRIFTEKVYDYELDEDKLAARTIGTSIDPKYNYVKNMKISTMQSVTTGSTGGTFGPLGYMIYLYFTEPQDPEERRLHA